MAAPPTKALQPLGPVGGAQRALVIPVFTGVTANGTSGAVDVTGVKTIMVEVVNSGSGTCTLNVQHTMDPWSSAASTSPWENARLAAMGSAGALTFLAGAQNVAGNGGSGVSVQGYQIQEFYPTLQFVVASVSGTVGLQVRLYVIPI